MGAAEARENLLLSRSGELDSERLLLLVEAACHGLLVDRHRKFHLKPVAAFGFGSGYGHRGVLGTEQIQRSREGVRIGVRVR